MCLYNWPNLDKNTISEILGLPHVQISSAIPLLWYSTCFDVYLSVVNHQTDPICFDHNTVYSFLMYNWAVNYCTSVNHWFCPTVNKLVAGVRPCRHSFFDFLLCGYLIIFHHVIWHQAHIPCSLGIQLGPMVWAYLATRELWEYIDGLHPKPQPANPNAPTAPTADKNKGAARLEAKDCKSKWWAMACHWGQPEGACKGVEGWSCSNVDETQIHPLAAEAWSMIQCLWYPLQHL